MTVCTDKFNSLFRSFNLSSSDNSCKSTDGSNWLSDEITLRLYPYFVITIFRTTVSAISANTVRPSVAYVAKCDNILTGQYRLARSSKSGQR